MNKQSLVSATHNQRKPRKIMTDEERIAKKNKNSYLAGKVLSSTTAQIPIIDLLQMLSPAVVVELRKTIAPSTIKTIDNSEIPQVNHALLTDDENLPLPSGKTKESYITVKCVIAGITILDFIMDTGSSTSMFSTATLDKFGWKPTRKINRKLRLADKKTTIHAIGWCDNVSITLGNNPAVSVTDNFLVVDSDIPLALGGTPWIRRSKSKADYDKLEMEVSSHGNTISVPISVKKIENSENEKSPLEVHFAEDIHIPDQKKN
jgi:Aspartyl protease